MNQTKLEQVAQRNGGGARVPRLPASRQAIADVASDMIRNGVARSCIGKRRGQALTEPDERAAAARQHGYVAAHRGVA